MKITALAGVSVLAIASALPYAAARAQDSSAEDETVLKTITITATKRIEDAHKAAATIYSADADPLNDAGVVAVDQLDKIFPDTAIDMRSSRAYTNITVRGQSSVDFYNPSVQLYVDGIPQDFATFAQTMPEGLESVELLYGPQGTLYGRGAIGGVFNVTTTKPDDTTRIELAPAISTTGGQAGLLVSGPLVDDTLYGDASINFRREFPDYTDMLTGDSMGATKDWTGRGHLRYAPVGSPLDIMFTAQRSRLTSTEEQFVMESMLDQRTALPMPSDYTLESTNYGLTAAYDLGDATITSLTSYQDRDLDRTIFGSYTPETQTTFNQELRIASNPDSGNLIDYVAGVSYQRVDFERRIPAYLMVAQQTIDSYAAFADLTWHATDRLDISPGLRFDYETVDAHAEGGVALDGTDHFSAVSPKLAASYALSDEWQVYGLYSTGFKAGGFTRTLTVGNIAYTYDPQHTYNGETGIKYRSADGSLEASLSGYYNVTKDYQMFVGIQPLQYLQNVGEVTSKGIDLKVRAELDSGIGITAGLGLNRSEFSKYRNPVNPGVDLTGNRVPYAPQTTANIMLDYAFDMPNGRGQVIPRVGVSYQSAVFFDETNTIGQHAYALVDAGVSWKVKDKVVADLFVNNLFDKTYTVYGFDASSYGFGNVYQLGRGRSIGGRLSIKF